MSLIIFFFCFSILTSNRPRGNIKLLIKRTNVPTVEGFWAQDQSVERFTAEREIAGSIPRAGPTNIRSLKTSKKWQKWRYSLYRYFSFLYPCDGYAKRKHTWKASSWKTIYRKWLNWRPLSNKCFQSNKSPLAMVKFVLDALYNRHNPSPQQQTNEWCRISPL